jgi:hypothetical protein
MSTEADDLRAHAERCVRLANGCSTPSVSEKLRALAAEYLERAAGLLSARPAAVQQQQQQQIQPKKDPLRCRSRPTLTAFGST